MVVSTTEALEFESEKWKDHLWKGAFYPPKVGLTDTNSLLMKTKLCTSQEQKHKNYIQFPYANAPTEPNVWIKKTTENLTNNKILVQKHSYLFYI